MRTKVFNLFIIILSIFTLIQLLTKQVLITGVIIDTLYLWVNNLIPALFPFFIISDILINYNITSYIPKIITNMCKQIFNISDEMLVIFLLSMVSGFPSNARNTRILYDKKLIDIDEANHILIFSHFASPIFILATVGGFFFSNDNLGIALLIIHYLSNIILGILIRNKFIHNKRNNTASFNYDNFGNILILAIKKAIDTILTICGIIIVFLILATIITNTLKLNLYNEMLVKGLLEVTIGIKALSNLSISTNYKLIITSMFLAWGGASVHIQVYSQIVGTKIKYYYFLLGRIYQMIIAGLLTYLWLLLGI